MRQGVWARLPGGEGLEKLGEGKIYKFSTTQVGFYQRFPGGETSKNPLSTYDYRTLQLKLLKPSPSEKWMYTDTQL